MEKMTPRAENFTIWILERFVVEAETLLITSCHSASRNELIMD